MTLLIPVQSRGHIATIQVAIKWPDDQGHTALTACAPRVSLVPGERMRTEPQSSEAAAFSLELEGHALGALPDTPLTGCKSDLVHLALYESLPHSAP